MKVTKLTCDKTSNRKITVKKKIRDQVDTEKN